jgi:hypothetical protein
MRNGEARKTPNSKLQTPEKPQTSKPEFALSFEFGV